MSSMVRVVLRGGSWNYDADFVSAGSRAPTRLSSRQSFDGFRVVKENHTSEYRSLRGGSWFDNQGDARAAYRNDDRPNLRVVSVGFRVCCVSPDQEQETKEIDNINGK